MPGDLSSRGVSGASCMTGTRVGGSLSCSLSPLWQREVDRNQELLTRIRQLQEREAEAEEKMKEQLERHRLCEQSLAAAGQKLREKEDGLAAAGEVRAVPQQGRFWGEGRGYPGVLGTVFCLLAFCAQCSGRRNPSKNTHFPGHLGHISLRLRS